MKFDLENDLHESKVIKELVKNDIFAQNLYAAMCNVTWYHKNMNKEDYDEGWSCSWRYAGGLVADLRESGEGYLDFYCSGIGSDKTGYKPEGEVSNAVRILLASLGWTRHK